VVERIEFELVARSRTTGQFKKTEDELNRLGKAAAGASGSSKASASSIKQLQQVAGQLGLTLERKTTPAVKLSKQQMDAFTRSVDQAGFALKRTDRALGLSRSGADAFTRAATRGVAAIGFISPTAATASAQIVGLTKASAAMTLAIGAAAVGAIALGTGLFFSAKAAISFESSFRGIRKTVSATVDEFARLESQNRKLARSLGENVNTINEIGQAAGQLGVAVGNIARFEQIVIEMASATDITARAAAFAFGGLIKVLNLTIDDVDRLSDEIVGLGNTFATTESEIVGLLNRIAGAGAVLKIPAEDLVSFAAAFSSVRVEQEAAGTAIQKVMLALQKATVAGGKELTAFSALLGVTAQQFRDLVRTDPTKAFIQFVEALGRAGPEAVLWLEALGLADQRLVRTFLKLASAGNLLNEVVEEGARLNEEGTARTKEFQEALDTTAGQLRLAKAAAVDVAVSVGDFLLPVITAATQVFVIFIDTVRLTVSALASLKDQMDRIPGTEFVGKVRSWISVTSNLSRAIGGLGSGITFLRDALGGSADDIDSLTDASRDAASGTSDLEDRLNDLVPDINAVGASAEDARKKLFRMFAPPTVEEAKAKLALLGLKQELNAIQTLQRPLTAGEKERANVLRTALIPSAQRLLETERLYSDVLSAQLNIAVGNLKTRLQLAAAANAQAREVKSLNDEFKRIPAEVTTEVIILGVESALSNINRMVARWNALGDAQAFAIRTLTPLERLREVDRQLMRERDAALIQLADPGDILADAQSMLDTAGKSVRTLAQELASLNILLGQTGLLGQAATFRGALVSLGQQFRKAGESATAYLNRLAAATLKFAQQQLDKVLGPTRETLALELRLAELQRRRLLLFRGGATEEELEELGILGPIDREIAALENSVALRKQEIEILELRAQLADRAILTDQEQIEQARLLIGVIADQSQLVNDLNFQLGLEEAAIIGVNLMLGLFSDAVLSARDAASDLSTMLNSAVNVPRLSAGMAAPAFVPNIGPRVNIETNITLTPEFSRLVEEVVERVTTETAEGLRSAGIGGSFSGSGTFIPL
jgi:TP901 family phage tail tape measure protein